MPFLVFVVGIVNTGWPRPLARSRTSGNHCVLVLGNVSVEESFSKKSRFVSARYTMHVNMEILHPHFPKYKKERLQLPRTRFAKHISAFCEFRFLHLQNQKTNIRKYVITPFSKFENNRLQLLMSGFREITENNNEGPCCNGN